MSDPQDPHGLWQTLRRATLIPIGFNVRAGTLYYADRILTLLTHVDANVCAPKGGHSCLWIVMRFPELTRIQLLLLRAGARFDPDQDNDALTLVAHAHPLVQRAILSANALIGFDLSQRLACVEGGTLLHAIVRLPTSNVQTECVRILLSKIGDDGASIEDAYGRAAWSFSISNPSLRTLLEQTRDKILDQRQYLREISLLAMRHIGNYTDRHVGRIVNDDILDCIASYIR